MKKKVYLDRLVRCFSVIVRLSVPMADPRQLILKHE